MYLSTALHLLAANDKINKDYFTRNYMVLESIIKTKALGTLIFRRCRHFQLCSWHINHPLKQWRKNAHIRNATSMDLNIDEWV